MSGICRINFHFHLRLPQTEFSKEYKLGAICDGIISEKLNKRKARVIYIRILSEIGQIITISKLLCPTGMTARPLIYISRFNNQILSIDRDSSRSAAPTPVRIRSRLANTKRLLVMELEAWRVTK